MFGPLSVLVDRLRDLSELIIKAAWAGAMGFGVAALAVTILVALDEPVGFGWRFFGWAVVCALLFVPAIIVWWFARNVRLLRDRVADLPERLIGLADDAVTELIDVASSARNVVAKRGGVAQLITGAWQLRNVSKSFIELGGAAAPVTMTLSPGALLVTAVAAMAGVVVLGIAFMLVALRIVV